MALPRVFVDSSVLIAASLSARGHARDLLVAGLDQRVELYASLFVLDETERNLRNKSPLALLGYEAFRNAELLNIVPVPTSSVKSVAEEFELKDAPIIAGAIAARAQHLATYDRKHLLSKADRILALHMVIACIPEQVLSDLSV